MSEASVFEGPPIAPTPSGNRSPSNGFLITALVLMLCGTALLALFAANTNAPVMMTVLCALAALGTFFVFGAIAGHIRICERTTKTDLVASAFDTVDHGVVVTNADGVIEIANVAAADVLGVKLSGERTYLESAFHDRPDLNSAFFRLSRSVARGAPRSEDVFVPPEDGIGAGLRSGRWLRITANPLPNTGIGSDQTMTVWSIQDLTRDRALQVQAQAVMSAQLAEHERMPAGYLVANAGGDVIYANPQISRWLGLAPQASSETIRTTQLLGRDGCELVRAILHRGTRSLKPVDIDLTTEDGFAWPATLFVSRIEASEGGTGAGDTFRAVIVPRREVPEAAADAAIARGPADSLARLFRSAPFGIATVGTDGLIAESNAAFTRLLLNTRDDNAQRAIDVLGANADAETRQNIETALTAVTEGRANVPPIEISVGEDHVQTRRLFFGATGRAAQNTLAVVYVIDATEEKALEQKFAQSQKMEVVGKLAGGIAHDFNNVMTAIIGFSDLLLGTHRPGDPSYQHLKNIKSSAVRAADLVRNLLAFSRQQQLRPQIVNVQEVVTDISTMLNRTLGEKVELNIRSERDLWPVKADRNELERVIVNLAVNARDAMPDGGTLSIRSRNVTERESARVSEAGIPIGEYVLLEIEDTGVGMPEDVLNKIFEPFFTTKGVGRGTGLGLSTVYGIVKQTGGFIYPSSIQGQGTTFRVYLPRHIVEDGAETAEADAPDVCTKRPHRDLTGVGRVLLVEDEDAVRLFATQALTRLGYEVFQAGDGYEALDLFEDEGLEVDLVVSDVKMPEMDGPSLLKALRKTHPELKFVFVSGYPEDAFSKTLADETNYTFLPKPYSLEQIAEVVKEQIAAG